ncbi:MAG: hypothetical protein M1828_000151 [Chrysothrix sp. TS-e1954]|nr:MAG: hypothetical protein M1828_000151 [Chrysothrix sp. TS-e1954]
MTTDILRPPSHLSHPQALALSQQAPVLLRDSWLSLPWPLSLLTTNDSAEKWLSYENLFYACLRTGDNRSAFACLQKLKDRFGEANERVMGLVGLYHEAVAPGEKQLEGILKSYEEAIGDRGTNMVVRKRHVALLKSMGRTDGAINALVDLLDQSPTDAEAWAELVDLYFAQGMYGQAVYGLEEVLLVTPNAWNMHARLGEVVYVATTTTQASSEAAMLKGLVRALKSYCRSVELCDDYLRGFYGLKMTTSKLKDILSKISKTTLTSKPDGEDDFPLPSLETVEQLNELATSKLAEIVRKHSSKTRGWEGYDTAEVIAARALLDQNTRDTKR